MGNCICCGEKVGWFRSQHPECAAKRLAGARRIAELIRSTLMQSEIDWESTQDSITTIASANFISSPKKHIIDGFQKAIDSALDDDLLSKDEEQKLAQIMDHFGLSQSDLDDSYCKRLVKVLVLRDIMEGDIPQRISVEFDIPFNLMKQEKLVWLFTDVDYYEQKTRTRYVGGSQGFSVRVAKGLYYRASAYKGERIQENEAVHVATGLLGVTDKHLYFTSESKSLRVKFDKIVAFTPYKDGVGVQRDAVSAKPMIFVTGDGWFTYNLVTNLSQR